MRSLALYAIRFYQRFISPYKGFACAYRYHTGHASCSALGLRAIQRYGIIDGCIVLRKRLYRCGVSHQRYSPPRFRPHRQQRGYCDMACDLPCGNSCTMPNLRSCPIFEALQCADVCNCAWSSRNKKDQQKDEDIHLPPQLEKNAYAR